MSCWEFKWLDRYVMPPDSIYMSIWTAFALTINAASIFMVYYECAFHLKAFQTEPPAMFTFFEFVLLLETLIFFFKAYPKTESHKGPLYGLRCFCKSKPDPLAQAAKPDKDKKVERLEQMWENSFRKVATRYLTTMFLIDFLSNVPFIVVKYTYINMPYVQQIELSQFQTFAYLRLLRITQLPKILNASSGYARLAMYKYPAMR